MNIEHVGSTSVAGLAAKPIIDISIVIAQPQEMSLVIEKLATRQYQHLGDLGIADREAFRHPPDVPRHNLYACPHDSLALRNHLVFRDHLRSHSDVARQYGMLKRQLAARFENDREDYTDGKTDFIVGVLSGLGLNAGELETIDRANRKRQ
jgi:GrpB-like predicted nucleotidyltransferase (UPF0157 family)